MMRKCINASWSKFDGKQKILNNIIKDKNSLNENRGKFIMFAKMEEYINLWK